MLPRLLALALLAAAAPSQQSPSAHQRNLDSFEYVWKTIRDTHWQTPPAGLDWNAIHDELRPKIEAAASTDAARAVISSMLDRLHQTHFAIIPAHVYDDLHSAGSTEGNAGLEIRLIEDHPVVTKVTPNSPAAGKGIKPGWQIVRIAGKEVEPVLQRLRTNFANSTLLDLMQTRAVASRLSGPVGTPVPVDLLDGADHPVHLEVDRIPPRGTPVKFGYMPTMNFTLESRKLRPDVPYIGFTVFLQPEAIADAFGHALKECHPCRGFVIDLRGNPGGLGVLAMAVAGWFTDQTDQRLGTMFMRGNSLKFVIFPRPEPFLGPLAVLVDGNSASTAEILAGGWKDLHRARIFGTRTAGAALPSKFEKLPNGDGFQYAVANYISEGGQPLEGIGVIPDEQIQPTRRLLLEGHDPALEAALSWIEKQKQ